MQQKKKTFEIKSEELSPTLQWLKTTLNSIQRNKRLLKRYQVIESGDHVEIQYDTIPMVLLFPHFHTGPKLFIIAGCNPVHFMNIRRSVRFTFQKNPIILGSVHTY